MGLLSRSSDIICADALIPMFPLLGTGETHCHYVPFPSDAHRGGAHARGVGGGPCACIDAAMIISTKRNSITATNQGRLLRFTLAMGA
jgi:hypothetical protein